MIVQFLLLYLLFDISNLDGWEIISVRKYTVLLLELDTLTSLLNQL